MSFSGLALIAISLISSAAHGFVIPPVQKIGTSDNTSCPATWHQGIIFSNKCYLAKTYNGQTVSFMGADHACRTADPRANLVTIANAFENSEVAGFTNGVSDYWIGLSDLAGVGWWSWVTARSTNISYTNWDSREPSPDDGEHAAYMSMAANGRWRTWPANDDTSNGYVCQIQF